MSDIIKSAMRVFEAEIEGLKALENWLGQDFLDAIEIISQAKGRVILSGMGKSGHICRKIAATLASTGTPAFFVHPGEASHGDLGMFTKDDVVILLSNSGETSELKDIINYCKRFDIALIGMVRRKSSILVSASDVALVLPEVPEACSVKAPTTSTTMMLALGDAIAVALLDKKGFKDKDFNVFHPGGKLGSAFIKVGDLMHKDDAIPLVEEGEKMSSALIEMTKKSFGCVGVISKEGLLQGIVTDGDLRRHMSSDFVEKPVENIMTKAPMTACEGDLASKALSMMQSKSITNLFVLDDKKPVGIVHVHDILRSAVA